MGYSWGTDSWVLNGVPNGRHNGLRCATVRRTEPVERITLCMPWSSDASSDSRCWRNDVSCSNRSMRQRHDAHLPYAAYTCRTAYICHTTSLEERREPAPTAEDAPKTKGRKHAICVAAVALRP